MNANISKKRMVVLGNPHSPHISVWMNALDIDDVLVEKISINHGAHTPLLEKEFKNLFSANLLKSLPKTWMYFFGGLFLFFKYMFKSNVILHAHSASGYGLMAFLSGQKYALTTYGSEIFGKDRKHFLYNLMMRMILKRAYLISASSLAMEEYLVDQYHVIKSKIRTFSLGVADEFLTRESGVNLNKSLSSFLNRHEFVFFSNRRITTHYNIDYILDEFNAFLSMESSLNQRCGLLLLAGDYNDEALLKVRGFIKSHKLENNIEIIDHFIDRHTMSYILENTSVTISLANTDQLSASILEAIAKKVPPVLNRLSAYADIRKYQCGIFLESMDPGMLSGCLRKIVNKEYDMEIYERMEEYVSSFLREDVIHNKIMKFYYNLTACDTE